MGREHQHDGPVIREAGKPGEGRRVVRGAQEFVSGHRELMRRQGRNIKSCNYRSKQMAALRRRGKGDDFFSRTSQLRPASSTTAVSYPDVSLS